MGHEADLRTGVMHPVTLATLANFPGELERHYSAFSAKFVHWAPASWDGVPSEAFTAIEQICHVRDIEIEGYQVRFRRTLAEDSPLLASIDSERIARERDYGSADAGRTFTEFRAARAATMALLRGLDVRQLERRAGGVG